MLDFVFVTIIAVGLGCTLLQLITVMDKTRAHVAAAVSADRLPAVSILKPLKGLDDQMEQNLRSFFELNYPEFELIFGVSEADDPVVTLIEKLRREYPDVPSRLVINDTRIGLNPKINILQSLYTFTRHEHLLISDSNTRVQSDYLRKFVNHFVEGQYGLLTSAICGIKAKSLGSIFENLHLNSTVLGAVLALERLFGLPISIGKSMLLRKSTLEAIGGFRSFGNFLAEDYFMRSAVRALGLPVSTAPLFVTTVNESWSLQKFFNRHSRWAKMRRHVNSLHYALEILANPIFVACLYAGIRTDLMTWSLFLITIAAKVTLDGGMVRLTESDLKWYHLFFIPIKDLLLAGLWIVPYLTCRVTWRGNSLRIGKHTKLIPVT